MEYPVLLSHYIHIIVTSWKLAMILTALNIVKVALRRAEKVERIGRRLVESIQCCLTHLNQKKM